jgi:hypothetical protein
MNDLIKRWFSSEEDKKPVEPVEHLPTVQKEEHLPTVKKETLPVKTDDFSTDVVIHQKNKSSLVQFRTRKVKIDDELFDMSAQEMIRMIKEITQTIGEYKGKENPCARYAIHALRKSRSEVVSDLEHYFKITWQLDNSGNSTFWA